MSALKWIKNRYYYKEFDENKIRNIQQFALVWNVFERECCGSDAKINTYADKVALALHNKLIPSLDTTWSYFHQRYIKNRDMTEKFYSLVFKKNDKQAFVKNTLLAESPSNKDKIEALMRIIFRLRNNLMHGEKKPEIFYDQDENFKHANQFLMNVCDLLTGRQCS